MSSDMKDPASGSQVSTTVNLKWPFLLPLLGPLACFFLVRTFATQIAQANALTQEVDLRNGGTIGVCVGFLMAFLVALWVVRVSRPGARPQAFLQPMALGLLLKLFPLALGTILLHGPLARFGSYEAFAIAFVASAFSYQVVFQQLFNMARSKAMLLAQADNSGAEKES